MSVAVVLPGCSAGTPDYVISGCERDRSDPRSVARVWDETLLELIREVVPAPTVHARNLFHTSAAMWDAWAAYDQTADGYFVTEKHDAGDVTAAPRGVDQLRRLPDPAVALRDRVRSPDRDAIGSTT